MTTDRLTVAVCVAAAALLPAQVAAQCRPPASSHEARLLAIR